MNLRISSLLSTYKRRMIIIVVGLLIGLASLLFTNNMAESLRSKEKSEVEIWAYSMKRTGELNHSDPIFEHIVSTRNNIPFIVTDGNLNVEHSHLIKENITSRADLLRKQLEEFSSKNIPIEVRTWNGNSYYIFYGESMLLKKLVYFPLIQLIIIAIFGLFGFITFQSTRHDEQNRVWIGLAKETAHQLGTPTSSLLGWIEYLRTQPVEQEVVDEMSRDLQRLMKVVDRFSKIGSETSLSKVNINEVVASTVSYFHSRLPKNVCLHYNGLSIAPQQAMVNTALFEWVIENLLKNALDAMQGKGTINVKISNSDDDTKIYIDVNDTGKGIAKANFKRIFEPGFTTKTRGWGLGLSLSHRIIEQSHKGKIFVVNSEIDKGTTIRIILDKVY